MSGRGQLAYSLYRYFWSSLDWVYPPCCGGCGQRGSRWCEKCQRDIFLIRPPFCPVCGRVTRSTAVCNVCRTRQPEYIALRSVGAFSGPLQNALHRLKYKRDVALGEVLARSMIVCLTEQGWVIDLVVPVPLGDARLSERGYNQAALLARPIALAVGLAYTPRALRRTRETRSQVGLSLDQRWINVDGSFTAEPELVRGKVVLVVDDVATSGATINSCAKALCSAGADRVYALTLARAL